MKTLFLKISFFCFLFNLPISINSQSEFLVNQINALDQRNPSICAVENDSKYMIVWQTEQTNSEISLSNICLQLFDSGDNKIGNEVIVNDSASGRGLYPCVASNGNGTFVVAWSAYNYFDNNNAFDIKYSLFTNLQPGGSEHIVNSFTPNTQTAPDVAMNSKGEFIIVWESWYQDGSDRGIYAQRFNSSGESAGNEFLVNSETIYSQARPKVKYFNDGNFIILWESWNESELGYNLFAKIYNSNGGIIRNEFMVNSYTDNYQWFGDIAIGANDNFDIVWCSWEQDGYDGGIYLQKFSNQFEKLGPEILVNSSTKFYQWLPKIKNIENENNVIVWSSWNIDGSREGIYYKILDSLSRPLTTERKINDYTDNYQWEPNFIIEGNDLIAVWSSWGQFDNNYDVIAKRIPIRYETGIIRSDAYHHSEGVTTSDFVVRVIDSSKITGDTYAIYFEDSSTGYMLMNIIDETDNRMKIKNFPLSFGEDVIYITEEFDGVSVEFNAQFNLDLDIEKSYFVNNSGTNLQFNVSKPNIFPAIAPIDIALIWGSTDTLADGSYSNPSDTALSAANIKEVLIPFTAFELLSGEKIDIVIFENSSTQNLKWDPAEKIVFMTPDSYKINAFSTHAQLLSTFAGNSIVLPSSRDTNYIVTKRPISANDRFTFSTKKDFIISDLKNDLAISEDFRLAQNYPNPFNPLTTINFYLSKSSKVLLAVFNILGEQVTTLLNKNIISGNHSVIFDASDLSSGVYLYLLRIDDKQIARKMMLLK